MNRTLRTAVAFGIPYLAGIIAGVSWNVGVQAVSLLVAGVLWARVMREEQ